MQERKIWEEGGISVHLGIDAKSTMFYATSKRKQTKSIINLCATMIATILYKACLYDTHRYGKMG